MSLVLVLEEGLYNSKFSRKRRRRLGLSGDRLRTTRSSSDLRKRRFSDSRLRS
jgi:hypothetical protein